MSFAEDADLEAETGTMEKKEDYHWVVFALAGRCQSLAALTMKKLGITEMHYVRRYRDKDRVGGTSCRCVDSQAKRCGQPLSPSYSGVSQKFATIDNQEESFPDEHASTENETQTKIQIHKALALRTKSPESRPILYKINQLTLHPLPHRP